MHESADDIFAWLEWWCVIAGAMVRSYIDIAVIGASLLKLLLHGVGLKRGQCNVDPWIGAGRAVIIGAPTHFWRGFQLEDLRDQASAAKMQRMRSWNRGFQPSMRRREKVNLGGIFRTTWRLCGALVLLNFQGIHAMDQDDPSQNEVYVDLLDAQVAQLDASIAHAEQHLDQFGLRWLGGADLPPQPLWPDAGSDAEESVGDGADAEVSIPVRVVSFQRPEVFVEIQAEQEQTTTW